MKFQGPLFALIAAAAATAACSSTTDPVLGGGSGGNSETGETGGSTVGSGGTSSGGMTGSTGGGSNGTSGGGPGSGGDTSLGSGGVDSGTGGDGNMGTGGDEGTGGSGTGGDGTGGSSGTSEGPCDVYNAAGNECVAAYSTIRRLLSTYTGPLYQVRSGSNDKNTGTGGMLHDIPMTADGFADSSVLDSVCANTFCTVATLYDQSGKGNDLTVAKKGNTAGGATGAEDDWESDATKGKLKVGGHDVYALYMEAHQGYRQTMAGNGMPKGKESQGIYELADGTHVGGACCWDFGNVTSNPTEYHFMDTLFFGTAYWGTGAGNGPWFGADFEGGVWMGGTKQGDPGFGSLDGAKNSPANDKNPSLRVKYALGFLKTSDSKYGLSMADLATATTLERAFEGGLPVNPDRQGAIVLGVGGDNSNYSFGTFYEGAIVTGYPDAATEQSVMDNVKAAGYGQ